MLIVITFICFASPQQQQFSGSRYNVMNENTIKKALNVIESSTEL